MNIHVGDAWRGPARSAHWGQRRAPLANFDRRARGDDSASKLWCFAIVALEPTGRVTLPAVARAMLKSNDGATIQALARGHALLLRPGGAGRALLVDARGRIVLPAWLRDAAGPSPSVLVGVRTGETPVVVVAPTRMLDAFGDAMAGERH